MDIFTGVVFIWLPSLLLFINIVWGSMYGHPFQYQLPIPYKQFCKFATKVIFALMLNSIAIISIWGKLSSTCINLLELSSDSGMGYYVSSKVS